MQYKNEKINKETLAIGVLYVAIIALFVILIILVMPFIPGYINSGNYNSTDDIVSACSDKGLEDSASCVINVTRGFYKYNLDNVGKDLTFLELKEQGGVCSSWSDYYSEIGKYLGFNTKNILVPVENKIYHEFSIWSAEDGYCILDQIELMCTSLQ